MKAFLMLVILLFLLALNTQAQQRSDSLESRLKAYKQEDTVKIRLLKKLCFEYVDRDNRKLEQRATVMLGLSEKLHDEDGKADALNFLGIVKDIDADFPKALRYYTQALVFARKAGARQTIASIANNLGLIKWKTGDLKAAIAYFFDGLKQAEALNNLKMQGNISSNIGLVFSDLKQYRESLQWQKKALALRLQKKDDYGLASTYGNLATAYSYLHRSDSSVYYQREAIRLQRGLKDDYGLGISYQNLGAEYKRRRDDREALRYYALSRSIRERIGDTLGLSFTYLNMAVVLNDQQKPAEAIWYGEKALAMARKTGSDERIAESSNGLAQLYRRAGKPEKALQMMEQYTRFHEKVFDQEMNKKVSELNVRYKTEEKQNQLNKSKLLLLEKENEVEARNLWLGGALAAVLLISLASVYVYRQHQLRTELLKSQSEHLLNEQRLEISRELHDSMGAQLTFMSSMLDGLKRTEQLDPVVNDKIGRLSEFSDNSITELKNTLWVLHTKEINLHDLKAKLLNFIQNAAEAKEDLTFNFRFDVAENFQLNSKQAVNLFRAVQEIVNNAIKYARASEIRIEVQQHAQTLTVSIADDGIGFDEEKESDSSFGLANIRNRISEINGNLSLATAPGKGTAYTLQLDL